MSSYAPLTIDGVEICSFRNGVSEVVALLFGPDELLSHPAASEEEEYRWEHHDPDEPVVIHELVSSGQAVRERLDALGLGMTAVVRAFDDVLKEERERDWTFWDGRDPEFAVRFRRESRLKTEMTVDRWLELTGSLFATRTLEGNAMEAYSLSWLMAFWEATDPRLQVRAILEAVPDAAQIRIDVTDIVESGWLSLDDVPHDIATFHLLDTTVLGSPVIVLTEGRTDARVLESAIRVIKPHLVGYLRFPDFSIAPEGSAGVLVKTLKTFAAAGVQNRVIALFDNDTGAAEALRALDESLLPRNILVMRLPDLPLARSYPTLGPAGPDVSDVNGRAASIELYLGEDVLRDSLGELRPVQWRGYSESVGSYQGEVLHKREVQEAFESKCQAALVGERAGDWSGLELIFDSIVTLLAT